VSFFGKLSRCVNAHLVTDATDGRRVIEQIGGTLGKDDVAAGMNIRPDMEQYFLVIVHVYVLIHDHDDLAEHHLPEAPNC
jgi:hypothetical protein